jgi:flagellar protein FlaG
MKIDIHEMTLATESQPVPTRNSIASGRPKQTTGESHNGGKDEKLKKAVESANKWMQYLNNRLDFSIDDSTKKIVVKVIDGNTNEVIRQIPPEEMLALSAKFSEIKGMLFNHQA